MGSTMKNKSRCSRTAAVRGSTKRITRITRCTDCGFKSNRAFNVNRHYERIHKPAKRQINCCGKNYATKGQYYQHCVNAHPGSRRSSIVSSTKYNIKNTTFIKKECKPVRRRSLRNMVKLEKKELKQEVYFDEDMPLIHYVKDLKLIKKEKEEEEKLYDIKLEDKCEKFDIDNCIEIFFIGDANSELNAIIQKEFLKNIDFDIFKII